MILISFATLARRNLPPFKRAVLSQLLPDDGLKTLPSSLWRREVLIRKLFSLPRFFGQELIPGLGKKIARKQCLQRGGSSGSLFLHQDDLLPV